MAIGLTEWAIIGGVLVLLFGAGAFTKWIKAAAEAKKIWKETIPNETK